MLKTANSILTVNLKNIFPYFLNLCNTKMEEPKLIIKIATFDIKKIVHLALNPNFTIKIAINL